MFCCKILPSFIRMITFIFFLINSNYSFIGRFKTCRSSNIKSGMYTTYLDVFISIYQSFYIAPKNFSVTVID